MDSGEVGRLGEAHALAWFTRTGYTCYLPVLGNAKYDLIVVGKEGKPLTVQVKSCSKVGRNGSYVFQLQSTRVNKNSNTIIAFDATGVDLLLLYVIPEDRILLWDAPDYHGRRSVSVRPHVARLYLDN